MKLRILSDLHIEFHPFDIPRMDDDARTVLVLAGDIGVIHHRSQLESFLRHAAAQFREVIYVVGNHEYYAGLWPDALEVLRSWRLPDNLHVLERECVTIDNVLFVCATLWSDFDGGDRDVMREAAQVLNDFYYIRTQPDKTSEPRRLVPSDILSDFQRSVEWLDQTLEHAHSQSRACVLVTHHGVSRQSIHDTYRDNSLNGAFVSACDGLLKRYRPLLAIHGHVHNSFDYYVGTTTAQTRVLVNPRGYTRQDDTQENLFFDPYLTIELELP